MGENHAPGFVGLEPRELLHRTLAAFNRTRLVPRVALDPGDEIAEEHRHRLAEMLFVESERLGVAPWVDQVPTESEAFVRWFRDLEMHGPGQHDPLFEVLAEDASLEQMRWFLAQETAGEAGFDDLVALTQLKLPTRAKLELARNYWDEMGRGHAGAMHGPLLERLGQEIGLGEAEVVWEALALGNLMLALALHRGYAYQSIGALGAIELTAPGRATKVDAGLKRLGVGGRARRYYALHATLDRKHADAWCREVLTPLVAERPEAAPAIAEGALMRLLAGSRCFARYRRAFARTTSGRIESSQDSVRC